MAKVYHHLFTLLMIAGLYTPASAQAPDQFCATPDLENEWLRSYQRDPSAFPKRSGELLYIPLTIHLVGDDEGQGFFQGEQLADALCVINNDFLPTDLQFYIKGPIRYLANSTYYEHSFPEGFQMMQSNNVLGTINCYFVQDPGGACGYFSFGGDAVAMSKGCSGPNSHTWSHEIGHFLSLPHTFSGWEGTDYVPFDPTPDVVNGRQVERLDGSNCTEAGDRFCDTPPDYLSYRWPCNDDGTSGVLQQDPADSTFRSDGSLFMSYASDPCMDRFSQEQIDAMRANLIGQRPELLSTDFEPINLPNTVDAQTMLPDSGAYFTSTSSVPLSWAAVPGAFGYTVDLELYVPFNSSTVSYQNFTTFSNSLTLTGLDSDRTYVWRVRPLGRYDACTDYSAASFFSVGNFVSTGSNAAPEFSLAAFPNPQNAGAPLSVRAALSAAGPVQMRIYNANGQVLRARTVAGVPGRNTWSMPTSGLPASLYFLELRGSRGKAVIKVSLN